MAEKWFVMRVLVDEGVDVDDDAISDALSAAEDAANEDLNFDGVKFKLGPEIVGYSEPKGKTEQELLDESVARVVERFRKEQS